MQRIFLLSLRVHHACGAQRLQRTRLNQPHTYLVYFDTDSANLTQDGQRVIGEIAASVNDKSPAEVVVVGYADGSTAHDAALADQRAVAVIQALTQKGVPTNELVKKADTSPSDRTGVAAH